MKFFILILFLAQWGIAKGSQVLSMAKPLRYLFANTSQMISQSEEKQFLEELFFTSVSLLVQHPVSPVSILPGTREQFDFIIEFTDTKTAHATFPRASLHLLSSHYVDAYTMLSDQKIPIVRILLDRVVYEEVRGEFYERSDAVVRLITVLAHEVYGNVYGFMGPMRSRKESEIFAFRTSIRFLENLIAGWRRHLDPTIQKMVLDLENSLQRERALLQTWENSSGEVSERAALANGKTQEEQLFRLSLERKRCLNYFSR